MHPSMHIASYHRLLESPCLRGYGPPVDGSVSTDRSLASSNGEDVRNTGAPGRTEGSLGSLNLKSLKFKSLKNGGGIR